MIKTVICGTGYWGKNIVKTLLSETFQNDIKVEKIIDINSTNFDTLQQTYKTVQFQNNYENVAWANLDLVVLALPPEKNISVIKQIKKLGFDGVFYVEKPFLPTGKSIFDYLRLFNKVKIFVGFIWLFDKNYQYIKKVLPKYGKINYIDIHRASQGPLFRKNVTVVRDYLIHDIALLNGLNLDVVLEPTFVEYMDILNTGFLSVNPHHTANVSLFGNCCDHRYDFCVRMFSSWNYHKKIRQWVINCKNGTLEWNADNDKVYKTTARYETKDKDFVDKFGNKGIELIEGELDSVGIVEKETKDNMTKMFQELCIACKNPAQFEFYNQVFYRTLVAVEKLEAIKWKK